LSIEININTNMHMFLKASMVQVWLLVVDCQGAEWDHNVVFGASPPYIELHHGWRAREGPQLAIQCSYQCMSKSSCAHTSK
jgi:hypothetical protein